MATIDWGTSPAVAIEATGEEIIRFSCGPGGSAAMAAVDTFVRPKQYLKLERLP